VIWLFYYEQLSMQEIATHLAISLSAVKNRLHKGRNELRQSLMVAYHRKASVFLKTKQGGSKGKGWVQQAFLADDYGGKRLRLSGLLKTENVEGATGVFLQAEGVNETLRSANMQQQPLQGTHDWTQCELEIDVPTESISLAFGLLLLGMGQVWLTDVRLEVVSEETLSPH
jgi:Sigma-70, region 4